MNLEEQENHRQSFSQERPCAKQSQQQSDHSPTGGVPERKEAEQTEFDKMQNSHSFVIWKMTLKSDVRPSLSFPTDAMVLNNQVDSNKHMDELKSSSLSWDEKKNFEVLDSNFAISREVTDRGFQEASLHGSARGTTGQSVPEGKTNRLHDL